MKNIFEEVGFTVDALAKAEVPVSIKNTMDGLASTNLEERGKAIFDTLALAETLLAASSNKYPVGGLAH